MQPLHVVALVERVDDRLPVRVDDRRAVRAEAQLVEPVRREQRGQRIEEVEQRLGVEIHVDEHEPAPALDAHRARARDRRAGPRTPRGRARGRAGRRARTSTRGTGTGSRRSSNAPQPSASAVPRWRHALWNAARSRPLRCARRRSSRRRSCTRGSRRAPTLLLAAGDLPDARPQPLELQVGELAWSCTAPSARSRRAARGDRQTGPFMLRLRPPDLRLACQNRTVVRRHDGGGSAAWSSTSPT